MAAATRRNTFVNKVTVNPGSRTTQYTLLSRTGGHGGPSLAEPTTSDWSSTIPISDPGKLRPRHLSSRTSLGSVSSTIPPREEEVGSSTSLETISSAILHRIFILLPWETLCSLLFVSSALTEAAAIALYSSPRFASTYRFAQFVTTTSHAKQYAGMVRELDLSVFVKEGEEKSPLAGWREWKYRDEPLYMLNAYENEGSRVRPKHPPAHRFLKQWHTIRDIPIGGILHVLEACKRLRKLDLSKTSLAPDRAIGSLKYPPTSFTSLIFISDVPKSWTWKADDGLQVVSEKDITLAITRLPQLEELSIRKTFWLSTEGVRTLTDECPRLVNADFRGSGMTINPPWAVKGSREALREILHEMPPAYPGAAGTTQSLIPDE